MTRLSENNRILWVNSIGMRKPTPTSKDVSKILNKLKLFSRRMRMVRNNIFVINPLVLPFHESSVARMLNRHILAFQLKRCMKQLTFDKFILWAFSPTAEYMLSHCTGNPVIYYITDDFLEFTGHAVDAIRNMEENLIAQADVLIASAQYLAEKKQPPGKEITVVNHGVQYDHFRQALTLQKEDTPADIRDIPGPIIGFYGEINDWLDLHMLAETARQKKEWSFVLIGRVAVEAGDIGFLSEIPNVHLLGQKKFTELPAYCAAFDAALIPMKVNELTRSVNPLKLREYLAAGLPVVSASLPEVMAYHDAVRFAQTKEELIRELERILSDKDPGRKERLSNRVANETWEGKVEQISDIINKNITTEAQRAQRTADG